MRRLPLLLAAMLALLGAETASALGGPSDVAPRTAGSGTAPAAAADPFQEANRLYESSRFDAAIAGYRALLERHPDDPALNFNLGNAYFRLGTPGSLGQSIVFYERAFALSPRDGDIRHNLDFALSRAGEMLIPPGMPPALFTLFHLLSGAELAALHWLGFWATMLLGSAFLLRESARERLRPWLTAAACFTTVATMPAFLVMRSSRLIPGCRARPLVTTMIFEPAVSA